MNKEQIFNILSLIANTFPNFEITQGKIDIWHKLLKDQNPATIMKNTERFILESKFPPTIADLRERHSDAHNSNILDRIKEWEANATRK